jgi:hypothetical protein
MAITLDGTTGITASGNITGNYILGNGSQLSGIITSVSSLSNGSSNVAVAVSNGNVTVGVGGTPNVGVFTTTGANVTGYVTATGNITGGNLSGTNIAGTLTTAAQTNITSVGTLGTLSVTGNASVGNLSTNGNITANYLFGNGSQLQGIDATSIQSGTSNVKVVSSGGNVATSVGGTPDVLVVTATGANIAGTLNATGNANVGNLGTAGIITSTSGISTGGVVSATGNVTGGNVTTSGIVTATGNVTGGNLITSGALSVTGNANVGNIGATNIVGTLTTASQTNITSVGTLTSLGVTGNISGGNVSGTLLTGTLATAAQPNVTSLGTLTSLTVQGNITQTGNLNITGNINATGNLNYQDVTDLVVGDPLIFLGANNSANLVDLGFIATYNDGLDQHGGFVRNHLNGVWGVFGNVVAEPTTVVDWGNAIYQPFRSGSATFAGANINGALTGATTINASGNASVGNISATNISGTLETASQTNITSVGTLGSLSVTGNVSGGNLTTAGLLSVTGNANVGNLGAGIVTTTGNVTASGNVSGNYLLGNGTFITGLSASKIFNGTSEANIGDSGGNANITIGGVSNVAVFTTTGANITGTLNATGNANVGNLGTSGNVTAGYFLGNGSQLTGIDATAIQNGSANVRAFLNGNVTVSAAGTANVLVVTATGANIAGTLNATGDVTFGGNLIDTGALTISTSSNGNITLSPNGAGVIVASKDIVNGQANGVGNIGAVGGFFNTIFAKATSAQYADLAEMYVADLEYSPGTVLSFGGEHEVTLGSVNDSRVAGVVSTNPSYIMNSGLEGEHVVAVALTGRVPCRVLGTVRKGDMMVSAGNGYARAEELPKIGAVIGKALENFDGDVGTIEVVVGRM